MWCKFYTCYTFYCTVSERVFVINYFETAALRISQRVSFVFNHLSPRLVTYVNSISAIIIKITLFNGTNFYVVLPFAFVTIFKVMDVVAFC